MGDYRFSFKAEFRMGGVKDQCDMWLNHSPTSDSEIDGRVLDWLEKNFRKGRESIDLQIYAAERREGASREEASERAELARLKAKYEGDAP